MKLNLITHLYNEEYLLPWWLEHHKNLFDNIFVIDYKSTDKSLEIVKDIIPRAKIIQSRNDCFDAHLCDQEVMELESSLNGIKICLNVTEFLISDRSSIIKKFKDRQVNLCYSIPRIAMIDNNPEIDVEYGDSLPRQKNFGLDLRESALGGTDWGTPPYRYIHNYETGEYTCGRHSTRLNVIGENFLIYLYKYSPWQKKFIERKLQIKNKISESDRLVGAGFQHFYSEEKMIEEMKFFLPYCKKYYQHLEMG